MSMVDVGARLKTLREKSGMLQKEVAAVIGVSKSSYSLYESGEREPGIATILSLSNYFHVSCDYLIQGVETDMLDIHATTGLSGDAIKLLSDGRLPNGFKSVMSDSDTIKADARTFMNDLLMSDCISALVYFYRVICQQCAGDDAAYRYRCIQYCQLSFDRFLEQASGEHLVPSLDEAISIMEGRNVDKGGADDGK